MIEISLNHAYLTDPSNMVTTLIGGFAGLYLVYNIFKVTLRSNGGKKEKDIDIS